MGFLEDSGLENVNAILGCKLQTSEKIIKRNLQHATRISGFACATRKNAIESMRLFPQSLKDTWNARFKRIMEIEKNLGGFLNPESEDLKDLQTDAIGQLSFQDDIFRSLNFMPYVLMGMMLFKVWAVPAMAICSPIFAWILPYLFLKFMYRLPISPEQYTEIMKVLWTGSPLSFGPRGGAVPEANMFSTRSMIQTVFMVFSFVNSLVQPIQNALHLSKTDTTIYSNGKEVLELMDLYKAFQTECADKYIVIQFRDPLKDFPGDPRRAIYILMEESERFRVAMRDFADLEILWRISQTPHLKPALILERGPAPLFQAAQLFDLTLGPKAVPSSVSFTGTSSHAALTGPNGGGKSSFLRAVLQCVIFAQTYGVAPAENLVLRRFAWICSGLRLQDAPGNLSMFETEIWFASNLLKRESPRGPGLVLYDELFHSTNPPDGIRTAQRFVKKLWERPTVISIVSTHIFELVKNAPESVQRLSCKAVMGKSGDVQYKYNVEEGICNISSVKSIWKRFEF
jgi:hypothetical protein